jgi:hypothetical protein
MRTGADCKTNFIERKADACKLEEIRASNPIVSMILDIFLKFTNFKFVCPMMPAFVQVNFNILNL